MYPSRVPPPEAWDDLEAEYVKAFRCIESDLPSRLFCGRPAVGLDRYEAPRCKDHLRPDFRKEPS